MSDPAANTQNRVRRELQRLEDGLEESRFLRTASWPLDYTLLRDAQNIDPSDVGSGAYANTDALAYRQLGSLPPGAFILGETVGIEQEFSLTGMSGSDTLTITIVYAVRLPYGGGVLTAPIPRYSFASGSPYSSKATNLIVAGAPEDAGDWSAANPNLVLSGGFLNEIEVWAKTEYSGGSLTLASLSRGRATVSIMFAPMRTSGAGISRGGASALGGGASFS